MINQLDRSSIPSHIAIIMDGNGRWAKKRNKKRIFGHESAKKNIRFVIEAASKIEVKYLTLFSFSKENWNRPVLEVKALMNLLISTLKKEVKTLIQNNVRFSVIGDINGLDKNMIETLNTSMQATNDCTGLELVLALNYSGRWDILSSIKKMFLDYYKNDLKSINTISEEDFGKYLSTYAMPEPELLIRTGGEKRISNFLLWELAYTELYFTDTLWPDFNEQHFYQAILDYQKRERRFGMTSEQIENKA